MRRHTARRAIDWFASLTTRSTTIRRRERKVWRKADTLAELADLTIDWFTGDLETQPGYYGPADIDEAEAPGMIRALAALNAAGFLTRNSQDGSDGVDPYGNRWRCLAAVDGYATRETIETIKVALSTFLGSDYGLSISPATSAGFPGEPLCVTWRDQQPYTRFGSSLDREDIDFRFCGCSRAAIDDVAASYAVVLYDRQAGRNTIWQAINDTFPAALI